MIFDAKEKKRKHDFLKYFLLPTYSRQLHRLQIISSQNITLFNSVFAKFLKKKTQELMTNLYTENEEWTLIEIF